MIYLVHLEHHLYHLILYFLVLQLQFILDVIFGKWDFQFIHLLFILYFHYLLLLLLQHQFISHYELADNVKLIILIIVDHQNKKLVVGHHSFHL